ncbi:MAG: hypothetical protein QOK05_1682 [Chloroflexota bacterium]|jgi:hypothetical protein|nr:hypothetical protein [Chloroflexota bacterium]
MSEAIPTSGVRPPGGAVRCVALFLAATSLGLVAACGTTNLATSKLPAGQDGAGGAGGADATTGEAPGVRYTNAKFHYRVDAPGAMKESADGSAAYLGAAERLEIVVVSGSQAADPKAFAGQDLGSLGSKPSFKVVSQPAQVTISNRAVQKTVYTWTDGVNAVTSKPNLLVSVRYYIPRDRATLAIVTYSIAANQYDPQGADDVVSTFAWL